MGMYTKGDYEFKKPSRDVWAVYCHCSATDNPSHDNVDTMRDWHVNDNGWSDVGYHIYIRKDGTIEDGRDLEQTPAAQSGYNTGSIAICCGGLEEFTLDQSESLFVVCDQINQEYDKSMEYFAHNMVAAKACPVYDHVNILNLDGDYHMTGSNIDPDVPDQELPDLGLDLKSPFPDWDVSPFRSIEADMPTVGKGDKSTGVAALQFLVASIGGDYIGINGVFDEALEKKVKRVQSTFMLNPDGYVGKKTWPAIFHFAAVLNTLKSSTLGKEDI